MRDDHSTSTSKWTCLYLARLVFYMIFLLSRLVFGGEVS